MPTQSSVPSAIARRAFVPGAALASTGLATLLGAGVAAIPPRWAEGAPVRPPAPAAPALLPPPPSFPTSPAPSPRLHSAAVRQDWLAFRHLYVAPDGRVVDTGNGNASHSEGQGWAMIAAEAADDPGTFASLLAWTTQTLRRRPNDRLHAWRYRPTDADPVSDLNNATDGDLYIAAALARAAVRWGRPDYAARAAGIARDVLGLVRRAGPRFVLLPGAQGFAKPGCLVVNPSYYTFGLFADLAAVAPSPLWQTLRDEGVALVSQARFGRWQLPSDWVRVDTRDGSLAMAPGWPPRFSWDAIRVPLHLAWGGIPAEPLFDACRGLWQSRPEPPAWADLATGELAPYAAPAGIRAVAALAGNGAPPPMVAATDYYGAGLVMLSRIAAEEMPRPGA